MRVLVPCLCLTMIACLAPAASPDYAAAREQAIAQAMGQPTHAPATPAEWSSSSAAAEQSARAEEAESVGAPVRITAQGAAAEHRFKVQGGRCYAAGLGWAFPSEVVASVNYQARPDGQPVNDTVGGARGRLKPSGGALTFCADRDGDALLTVMSLKADGSAAMNELHEYALVLASRTETEAAVAKRRGVDAERGASAKAHIDANIAEAEAREARALAGRCQECREGFRLCQVQNAYARSHPRASARISSCDGGYADCAASAASRSLRRNKDAAPCGEPPR